MCSFFKKYEIKIEGLIIIDLIFNICYVTICFWILSLFQEKFQDLAYPGYVGPHIWSFIVIIADIVLLFALEKSNTKLMLFWILTMMVNITLLLITSLSLFALSIYGFIWTPTKDMVRLPNILKRTVFSLFGS